MDNSLNLTRLLYCKDEVELMIVYRLLQKQCLNEVLFWIAEYYYSGYTQEAWNLVFKCYYDFYAALNPTIECSLFKKVYPLEKRHLPLSIYLM